MNYIYTVLIVIGVLIYHTTADAKQSVVIMPYDLEQALKDYVPKSYIARIVVHKPNTMFNKENWSKRR